MIQYPAKIKKDNDSYNVEFPDLPGCFTYGSDLESALSNAKEALTGYLESIDLRKIKIPNPSTPRGKNIYYIAPDKTLAFAIWMKLKRAEKGLTQKKAAQLLNVNYQAYQKYEDVKKCNPTLKTIEKIEAVFNSQIIAI